MSQAKQEAHFVTKTMGEDAAAFAKAQKAALARGAAKARMRLSR
jgi:hypothetical protein